MNGHKIEIRTLDKKINKYLEDKDELLLVKIEKRILHLLKLIMLEKMSDSDIECLEVELRPNLVKLIGSELIDHKPYENARILLSHIIDKNNQEYNIN